MSAYLSPVVTIDAELLRRIDASSQSDLEVEGVTCFPDTREPGELSHNVEY